MAKAHLSFFDRTGEVYPHKGHLARGPGLRLTVYLDNLKTALARQESEPLLWVICAGVWHLELSQATELAALLKKLLNTKESNP